MHHDEKSTRETAEFTDRRAPGRFHIIDVECAPDLGVVVRVLNLLVVARARVASIASHVDGERMHLRVNARGMDANLGQTLRWRVEAMEGVSNVRVVSGK